MADMSTKIALGLQAALRVGRLIDEGKAAPEMISMVTFFFFFQTIFNSFFLFRRKTNQD